jgi:hypothetical protein
VRIFLSAIRGEDVKLQLKFEVKLPDRALFVEVGVFYLDTMAATVIWVDRNLPQSISNNKPSFPGLALAVKEALNLPMSPIIVNGMSDDQVKRIYRDRRMTRSGTQRMVHLVDPATKTFPYPTKLTSASLTSTSWVPINEEEQEEIQCKLVLDNNQATVRWVEKPTGEYEPETPLRDQLNFMRGNLHQLFVPVLKPLAEAFGADLGPREVEQFKLQWNRLENVKLIPYSV